MDYQLVALIGMMVATVATFVDIDGRSRKLSAYRGKVVLLDFRGSHNV